MAASEPARHALYARLEEVLGDEHADTLMTHLPVHRADEVATKADIADLKERFDRLEGRFDRLEDRFDRLQETMTVQLRTYTVTTIGAMTALTGIFAAVVAIIQ